MKYGLLIASSPCEVTFSPTKLVRASRATHYAMHYRYLLTHFLIPHFMNNLILFNTLLNTRYTQLLLLGYTLFDSRVDLGCTHNYLIHYSIYSTLIARVESGVGHNLFTNKKSSLLNVTIVSFK